MKGIHTEVIPEFNRPEYWAERLWMYVNRDGVLKTKNPWTLSPEVAQDLLERYGSPLGGWSEFMGLLAGTGMITCHPDRFEVDTFLPVTPTDMVHAFTRYLCPPQVAASVVFTFNVSPLVGLRLASLVGTSDRPINFNSDLLDTMVYLSTYINLMLDVFKNAEPYMGYDMRGVSFHVYDAIGDPGIDPASLQMMVTDLINGVLIPAGAAVRNPAGLIMFNPDVLNQVHVLDVITCSPDEVL